MPALVSGGQWRQTVEPLDRIEKRGCWRSAGRLPKCLLGLVNFESNFTKARARPGAPLLAATMTETSALLACHNDIEQLVELRRTSSSRARSGRPLRCPECEEDFANPFGHLSTISTLLGESWGCCSGWPGRLALNRYSRIPGRGDKAEARLVRAPPGPSLARQAMRCRSQEDRSVLANSPPEPARRPPGVAVEEVVFDLASAGIDVPDDQRLVRFVPRQDGGAFDVCAGPGRGGSERQGFLVLVST